VNRSFVEAEPMNQMKTTSLDLLNRSTTLSELLVTA
jgi:hypothetical protein